ncbi:hypothetical protein ACEQPO_18225 [Bacillus sp. SL00103]
MGIKPNDASEHREHRLLKNEKRIHPSAEHRSTGGNEFLITQSITEDQAICVTYATAGRKEQFWGWVKSHSL